MNQPNAKEQKSIKSIADKLAGMSYSDFEHRDKYHKVFIEFLESFNLHTLIVMPYTKEFVALRKNWYDAIKYIDRSDMLQGKSINFTTDTYGNFAFYLYTVVAVKGSKQ